MTRFVETLRVVETLHATSLQTGADVRLSTDFLERIERIDATRVTLAERSPGYVIR